MADVQGSVKMVYQVAMDRLTFQMNQVDAIDTKVSVLLGSGSAILAAFAAFGALGSTRLSLSSAILFSIGIVAYIFLVVFGVLAYRVSEWLFGPKLDELSKYGAEYDEDTMQEWAADVCIRSYEQNKERIGKKASMVDLMIYMLAIQVISLAVALVLPAFLAGIDPVG